MGDWKKRKRVCYVCAVDIFWFELVPRWLARFLFSPSTPATQRKRSMARAAESLSPLWVSFSERPHFFFPFDIFRRVSTELLSFTHFPFFYREINPKPRKLLSSTLFFCYSGFYKTLFRFVLLGQIERKGRSSFALWCCGGAHRLFIQWPSQTLGPATREDGRKYCHSRNRRGQSIRTGQASLWIFVAVWKVISRWTSRLYQNCIGQVFIFLFWKEFVARPQTFVVVQENRNISRNRSAGDRRCSMEWAHGYKKKKKDIRELWIEWSTLARLA